MNVHVHAPSGFPIRRHRTCPTCQRETRFAGLVYVWYDAALTCCECGDSWAGGERAERPFRPRWRERAMQRAEQIWTEAGQYSEADLQEWLQAERPSAHPGGET